MKGKILMAFMTVMMAIPVMDAFAASESSAKKYLQRARSFQSQVKPYQNKSAENKTNYDRGENSVKVASKYYKLKQYDRSVAFSQRAMIHFKKVDRGSSGSSVKTDDNSSAGKANVAINRAKKEYSRARNAYKMSFGRGKGAKYYNKGRKYLYQAQNYKKKSDYKNAIRYANMATSHFKRVR